MDALFETDGGGKSCSEGSPIGGSWLLRFLSAMSPSAPSRTTSLSDADADADADAGVAPILDPAARSASSSSSSDLPGPDPGPDIPGRVNPLLPLSAHYDLLNRTVLPAFASAHAAGSFSVAYAVGAKFVEMALVSIPSHGYFGRDTGGGGLWGGEDGANPDTDHTEGGRDAGTGTGDIGDVGDGDIGNRGQPPPPLALRWDRSTRDAVRVASLLEDLAEREGTEAEHEVEAIRALADLAARERRGDRGRMEKEEEEEREEDEMMMMRVRAWSLVDWVANRAGLICGSLVEDLCGGGE